MSGFFQRLFLVKGQKVAIAAVRWDFISIVALRSTR